MNNFKNYPWYYQQSYCTYILQNYNLPLYLRQDDTFTIPDYAKTKKVIPIGEEFFIPEFKISQCNITRVNDYPQYYRSFKISMNKIKQEFKNTESSVKKTAQRINDELNKLIGNNNEEIRKLEKDIDEKKRLLYSNECAPYGSEINDECLKHTKELKELEEKLIELRSRKNFWDSLNGARNKFQNDLKVLANDEIPNVSWPRSWPSLEEIEFLPVIAEKHLDLPKTLKDMNINPSLIKEIPIPEDIGTMLNIPSDIKLDTNLDNLKKQIQFDSLSYSPQQVLQDIQNKAIGELQKYNMCLFIKNTPYSLQIQLEYVSNFKKLVEYYIYGCLEKAKKAAIAIFAGYIPSIINTYGATIPPAISNAFATYWTTFKKCLFDVYNTFKKDLENITNTKGFDEFIKAIEKYVSIDFVMEKRFVPWEKKASLADLVTGGLRGKMLYDSMYIAEKYMYIYPSSICKRTHQVPNPISPEEEYVQSEPQFSYFGMNHTMDEESLIKTIYKCGRLGMWIFVTLKEVTPEGLPIFFWLNVKSFKDNILSGYSIDRAADKSKIKKYMDISIQNIKNLVCYDLYINPVDNENDLIAPYFPHIETVCSMDKGQLFGKGYLDADKGILIYYEVYYCGVYTKIYIDDVLKSDLYLPRIGGKVYNVYNHPVSATNSYIILLDITKSEKDIQNRLRINISEKSFDEITYNFLWEIKLPW
ncbi:hypothetical protein [Clostridium sp.]|uniref:hypothetical protein n=1 Tax=Clostridium sp. TaxID=1506 RepID=UPI0025C2615F|nr:hypothetical protein [Clostridium sp.]